MRRNAIRLCELGRSNKDIAHVLKRHVTVVGRYVKDTRERLKRELAMKIGELYDTTDEDGKRIYTYRTLGEELEIPTSTVERIYKTQYQELIKPPEPEPEPERDPGTESKPVPEGSNADQQPESRVETTAELEPLDSPEAETDAEESDEEKDEESRRIHTEMQYRLLWLGNMFGLSVWVATDNRKKSYEGVALSELPGMLAFLPSKIRAKTPRSIERIDVLWLQGDNIVAAFEVEHSTNIDSGLLRMSDMLLAMDGTSIFTFVVAPNGRVDEAKRKMNRPTFKQTGQTESCRFIHYSDLTDKFEDAKRDNFLPYNWQELLDEISYKL